MKLSEIVAIALAPVVLLMLLPAASAQEKQQRVNRGLLVLYDFAEGKGQTVHDRSGVGTPLDLSIDKSSGVRWSKNTLALDSSALIASTQPAKKIIDAVKKSNAITLEAWLKPASNSQIGPARIVSLSANVSQRNVTLGQEKDVYDVRLRATGSDNNGLPSTASPSKSLQPKLTHVVFTRDAAGTAIILIDGKQVVSKKVGGNFSNWDGNYRLALANEVTKERPWLGELHLVAIYDRALSGQEVQQNFAAGIQPKPVMSASESLAAANLKTFDRQIAPLFAKHCLECHDSAIKKGGLDLSRKIAALAGGDSGKVIAPGKAEDSLIWDSVTSDEMPKDRPPLSANEKVALQKWLDAGANWSVEVIDPAVYLHEGHAGDIWVQRLTVPEYIATVRSAVGVDIAKEARELLPPDLRADGFSNTAYNLNIDLKHVEAYSKLAEIIVSRMDVLKFAARFSK
ncbi:MAG TPA: LamG-like jellyroll fold domain-containing protein, partial [Pirellulaceae bacterium]|nr:LamG-like jellyroll fold domain-containing protein [Pirellulaceae bacterium]